MIRLKIVRKLFEKAFTRGDLFVNGEWFSHVLEDTDRFLEKLGKKVPGETAIPRGTYEVVLDMSARFGKIMPHVLGVKQFDGIRIHNGSYPGHTDGCPLVGYNEIEGGVNRSREAFRDLMEILMATIDANGKQIERITLEVV